MMMMVIAVVSQPINEGGQNPGAQGARGPKHVLNFYVGTLHTKFSVPPLNGRRLAVAP